MAATREHTKDELLVPIFLFPSQKVPAYLTSMPSFYSWPLRGRRLPSCLPGWGSSAAAPQQEQLQAGPWLPWADPL